MYNFEDLGKSNSNGIISRLSPKQKKIIAAVVGILVILVAALCIKNCGGSGGDKKTISLVNFYYENGEYDTDFAEITLYDNIAINTCEYCLNGDLIGIRGRIQTNDKKMEIVADKVTFLSSRKVEDNGE